jgi:hypothetical protein
MRYTGEEVGIVDCMERERKSRVRIKTNEVQKTKQLQDSKLECCGASYKE